MITKRNIIATLIYILISTILVDQLMMVIGEKKHYNLKLKDGSTIDGDFRRSVFSYSGQGIVIFKWEVKEVKK